MTDDLATTFLAVAHQVRVVLRRHLVHGNRGLQAILLQSVQDAEDAHPVPVIAVAVGVEPGEGTWPDASRQVGQGKAALRRVPVEVVQVHNGANGHPGVVRPAQRRAIDDGRPVIVLVVHPESSLSYHIITSTLSACIADSGGTWVHWLADVRRSLPFVLSKLPWSPQLPSG